MLQIVYSNQFKKDFKKIRKLPILDLKKIFDLIIKLENDQLLESKFKDHELIGNY